MILGALLTPIAFASAPALRAAPPPPNDGSALLDVYRAGDLALMVDADGEWLVTATPHIFSNDLNWVLESISDRFYDHFDNDYEYLCVLLVKDLGFFGAFYSPLANDVRGIGYDSLVASEVFDQSRNALEGFIFMNAAELWDQNPEAGRYVFGQEFMHRWGAFVNVEKEGLDPDVLLGRDTAHWSYWLDTTNSPMEGNDWVDNGDGTWTVDYQATSTYSDLDLYLMGLVGPEEVGPQTVLLVDEAEQDRVVRNAAYTPEGFAEIYAHQGEAVTVTATPVSFTIDDIIAAEGPREPSVDDSPKSFHMAFVVLVLTSDVLDESTLTMVDGVRQRFEADWEADVRGLADLDTTLGDGDAPEWGAADTGEDTATDTGEGGDTAADTGAVDTGTDEAEKAGCGCNSPASLAPLGGILLAGLAALRRRIG